MESTVFERIRGSLLEKRESLAGWLRFTPVEARQERLGPLDERATQAHLHVIDTSLGKIANQTLGLCTICHEYVDAEFPLSGGGLHRLVDVELHQHREPRLWPASIRSESHDHSDAGHDAQHSRQSDRHG